MTYPKFPSIPRLNKPVTITEKIDGTNGQVYIKQLGEDTELMPKPIDITGDELGVWAGSRNRWLSVEADNFGFAAWVDRHLATLAETLGEGQHFGEWWGPGIQRGYGLAERRFSLFNTSRWEDLETTDYGLSVVPVLGTYGGNRLNDAVDLSMDNLHISGSVASPGFMRPEGVVVFHTAANQPFKATFESDGGKWTA